MQKKRNNPQANPSGFAYVRAALELTLEISFDTIIALAFSISKRIRIRLITSIQKTKFDSNRIESLGNSIPKVEIDKLIQF